MEENGCEKTFVGENLRDIVEGIRQLVRKEAKEGEDQNMLEEKLDILMVNGV